MIYARAPSDSGIFGPLTLAGILLNEQVFQRLRNEQGIGYIVMATPFEAYSERGLALVIQSPTQVAATLRDALHGEVNHFFDELKEMKRDDFEKYKKSAIAMLGASTPSLETRGLYLWNDLRRHGGKPRDEIKHAIRTLQKLSLADFQAFCKQLLSEEHTRQLVLLTQDTAIPRTSAP